ncbi:hypothetical protein TWF730_007436 [Orbilia blumenaviensis]|uniref:Uncharacterized protein n=1 Tax=Orbilia blumenaviensis TaxID=1796055 RepID=A0AAV9V7S5_9PEZI
MGCTLSVPELAGSGTYYVNPAGAAAGDAFGVPAIFTTGFFTCSGGPPLTPIVTQTVSGTTSVYTCDSFKAGIDTSLLCPGLTRSSMTGEYDMSFTAPIGGAYTVLDSRQWTVIQIADNFVTDGTTYTTNAYSTVLGGPTTVTQTTTVDDNPATATVTHTSYGRTRHVDVPVTSYTTEIVTKTTSVKTCATPVGARRRVRGVPPAEPVAEPAQLVKRQAGYRGFDGTLGQDSTLTLYSTVVYEPNYGAWGTVTVPSATETTVLTVNGSGQTLTETSTTRVHDATTEYTTISKTKTQKTTTTVTKYPTTCPVLSS